jgi:hypothetical protein
MYTGCEFAAAKAGSTESYGLTFVATGCCNYQPNGGTMEWWSSQSPSTVFNDMYQYCTLVKGGTASAAQKSFCGCGDAPPKTCTLQTAFTTQKIPWYFTTLKDTAGGTSARVRSASVYSPDGTVQK